MTYLIDTHILIWWLADDPKLPANARVVIVDGSNEILVSSVTIAEIAIKKSLGTLDMSVTAREALRIGGFDELPLTADHAARLETLPWHHRDPFDRMLIAQAQHEGHVLVTADHRFREYDVAVL